MKNQNNLLRPKQASPIKLEAETVYFSTCRLVKLTQWIVAGGVVCKSLFFVLGFIFLLPINLAAQFAGGIGTKQDPYQISTWKQLASIKDKQSAAFILIQDLNKYSEGYVEFAGPNANSGSGWLPIPNFSGVLDGNGKTLADLTVFRPAQNTVGLFAKAGNATFKNLHLENFTINAGNDIGGLLGIGINVQISNCSFDGKVEGKYYTGGLVGTIGNSEIFGSYSLGQVSGFKGVGGIAGNAYHTNINQSFSSGEVAAESLAGGLVGFFHSYSPNFIENCYSISQVTAESIAGGLIGKMNGASLLNSYAAGKVTAKAQSGGLMGLAESKFSIQNCFWDEDRTGQSSNAGGGLGLRTQSLKGKNAHFSQTWDFAKVWGIKEPSSAEPFISYPYIKTIAYDEVGKKDSKNPIPGLESAKIPTGFNFPLVLVKTYGDPDYILGDDRDSIGQTVIYRAEDTTVVRIHGNMAVILKAGSTKITAESGNGQNSSYHLPFEQTLTIQPADLQVSAVPGQKKVFGAADQEFEFTGSGFKYKDGPEVLSGKLGREEGEDVGQYLITKGTLDAGPNYHLHFTAANFEITKKEVIIEAQANQKIFGSVDPELSFLVKGIDSQEVQKKLSGQLVRETGEKIGSYVIQRGDLDLGSNFEIIFKEAVFQIIQAELSTILDPAEIQTPWSVMPTLPKHVSALTKDGQILELLVRWEKSNLNLMENGTCSLVGNVDLPDGIGNPEALKALQKVAILPKEAPEDVLLSEDKFEPGSAKSATEIGRFTVVDKTDDFHTLSLAEGQLDNSFFQIAGNSLVWNNSGNSKTKNSYSILVLVLDRGGNVFQKEFELTPVFGSINDIEVFNTFTPDEDGINDTWGVPSLGQSEGSTVQIFERSGSLLFSTDDPEKRWDGSFQGKSLPEGTYYWVLNFAQTGETRKGFLNLMRK